MFTDKTRRAIQHVAEDCAQDMEYEYASDAAVVAETALDAGRLSMWKYPEAQAEVDRLVSEHGYSAVLKAAMKIVPTA